MGRKLNNKSKLFNSRITSIIIIILVAYVGSNEGIANNLIVISAIFELNIEINDSATALVSIKQSRN